MGLSPRATAHFARQRIDAAAKAVAAVADKRLQDSEENQRAYATFHNSLALFSGGTIALSVTYLGYLKTLSKPVVHSSWLIGSWVALLMCLTLSLFFGFFVAHYAHFYRSREYCEAVKKRYETEITEVANLNAVNLQTDSEIEAYVAPRQQRMEASKQNARWNERREIFYRHAWIWTGRLARLAFLAGLGLLLGFAVKNM